MSNNFIVYTTLDAEPDKIFRAWLSSQGHTAMTGSPAKVEPRVGGKFTASAGYIFGVTIKLNPDTRLIQAWRTTEFPEGSPNSNLEIILGPRDGATKIILHHTNLPEGQAEDCRQGWEDY